MPAHNALAEERRRLVTGAAQQQAPLRHALLHHEWKV